MLFDQYICIVQAKIIINHENIIININKIITIRTSNLRIVYGLFVCNDTKAY